jgi:uncharacterized protein (TIGR03435 family)
MLQHLLQERFGLRVHREMLPVQGYRLAIAKGGSKLVSAKAPAQLPAPPKARGGAEEKGSRSPSTLRRLETDKDGFPIVPDGVNQAHNFATGQARVYYKASPVSALLDLVLAETGQPAVDVTGLTGTYDIRLDWVTQMRISGPPDVVERHQMLVPPKGGQREGEPFAAALRRQLGLELRADKIPLEVLIVDYAARTPTAN